MVTLSNVWQRYDEWLETGKRRPRDDLCRYHKHLEPRFGEKSLSEISPFDLERMKSDLLKEGLSPATTKHCLVLVRQLFNKATSWKLWDGANPVKEVKLPRLNNRRERFLTTEEADRLLEELKEVSRQLYEIAFLSLYTGMRAGEIFALKWGHVDMTNEIILVADPKGGASRNTFMSAEVKGIVPGERKPQTRRSRIPRSQWRADQGRERRIRSDSRERLKINDGISDRRQKVSFHTLPHTFAIWLAIQGTPILTIKELLGHKTLAMTERYGHLIPDVKREAVAGIGKMMKNRSDADQGCCAQES